MMDKVQKIVSLSHTQSSKPHRFESVVNMSPLPPSFFGVCSKLAIFSTRQAMEFEALAALLMKIKVLWNVN
jgi:hypothetical protein